MAVNHRAGPRMLKRVSALPMSIEPNASAQKDAVMQVVRVSAEKRSRTFCWYV